MSDAFGKALGQTVVVDNKPGNGSSIAADIVAKAAPDGYTMLIASPSSISVNPALNPRLTYTPADLLPVTKMTTSPLVLAVSAAARKDERNTNLWLTITALLGATFVGGQVYEFTSFYREGLGFTKSLFSSSFYTLTGFHGVHVTVGVIMLLALVGINKRGRLTGKKAEVVELVGLYWHFVDIVWIIIFTLVYLIPS